MRKLTPPCRPAMKLKEHIYNIFIILFVSGICYLNNLNGDFVFDDTEAILKNEDLDLRNPFTNLFFHDFWGMNISSKYSHKSYRPLSVLLYRINIYLVGYKSPYYFHATSIVLYMLVCGTLYVLLSDLLVQTKHKFNIAFSTSILFAVHPIHTEVVSSIVGQADLLCSLLFFLSLIFYNRSIKFNSNVYFYFTLFFATLSMFCKETGITVLGICCFYDVLRNSRKSKITFSKYFISRQVTLAITAFILLYIRWKIIDFTEPVFQPVDNPASFASNLSTRVLSYNYIYFINSLLLIWPKWLCFDWSMGCISLINNFSDIRVLMLCFYWLIAYYFVSIQIKRKSKLLLIALVLCIIPFLPASNIWLRVGFVIAERVLFLPSVGFCLMVAVGFNRLKHSSIKYTRYCNIGFIFLCITFGVRTCQRSNNWLVEYDLFSSALEVCPNNAKVHYNIAKVSADGGDLQQAETEYRTAIMLNPTYDQAMNNLANVLRDLGQLDEAKQLLRKAVQIRPEFAAAWMNLGIVLATLDEDTNSELAYLTALKYRRKFPDCIYNLGNLYLKLEKNDEALATWERAVILDPCHIAAWSNTLVLLDGLGEQEKVLKIGKKALEGCPNVATIHFTLGNTLGKLNRWTEAEQHFKTAIELTPDIALYYSNFGVLYHRWGKHKDAIRLYEKALQLDPHLTSASKNLKKLK